MAVVLKAFDYAADGFTVERLTPGDEREFGDLAAGLTAAGYIDGAAQDDAVGHRVIGGEDDDAPAKKRGK